MKNDLNDIKKWFILVVFPLTALSVLFLPQYGKRVSIAIFLFLNALFVVGVIVDTHQAKNRRKR